MVAKRKICGVYMKRIRANILGQIRFWWIIARPIFSIISIVKMAFWLNHSILWPGIVQIVILCSEPFKPFVVN